MTGTHGDISMRLALKSYAFEHFLRLFFTIAL